MKRSEVNAILCDAAEFLAESRFFLPPFAHWTIDEWRHRGAESTEIIDAGLGWDITDFGLGNYRQIGLCVFTMRNGRRQSLQGNPGKTYAEKVLIVDPDQVTPLHFHWKKMEDIINRGGGDLVVQLFNSDSSEDRSRSPVQVATDGIIRKVPAGGSVVLRPGESITLPPRLYHQFWAAGKRTLVGEVSLVNDDNNDNRFFEPVGRFPVIEEDEAPLHLLVNDYAQFIGPAGP